MARRLKENAMTKYFTRILLLGAALGAVGVIVVAMKSLGFESKEAWATVAAALAVIVSVLSAWSTRSVLELQANEREPYVYPSIDVESRYGLIQLRIENYGGGPAFGVKLNWEKPLLNSKGEPRDFGRIPVLLQKESLSILVDGQIQFYGAYKDCNYSGKVEFKNASGRKKKYLFNVSAEKYRATLTYTEEAPKTHHQLQQIPDQIEKLTSAVSSLKDSLEKLGGHDKPEI
jgi:hypothetical protein